MIRTGDEVTQDLLSRLERRPDARSQPGDEFLTVGKRGTEVDVHDPTPLVRVHAFSFLSGDRLPKASAAARADRSPASLLVSALSTARPFLGEGSRTLESVLACREEKTDLAAPHLRLRLPERAGGAGDDLRLAHG